MGLVQDARAGTGNASGTVTATLPNPPSPGNLLVAAHGLRSSTSDTTTWFSDGDGLPWAKMNTPGFNCVSPGNGGALVVAYKIATGLDAAVRVTSGANYKRLCIAEFDGFGGLVDTVGEDETTPNSISRTTPAVTPTVGKPALLWFASLLATGSATPLTSADLVGIDWGRMGTGIVGPGGGNFGPQWFVGYRILPNAAGPESATFTGPGSGSWCDYGAAFLLLPPSGGVWFPPVGLL